MGTETAESPSLVSVPLIVRVIKPTGSVLTETALKNDEINKPTIRVGTLYFMGIFRFKVQGWVLVVRLIRPHLQAGFN